MTDTSVFCIADNYIPEEIFHAAGLATLRFTQIKGQNGDGVNYLPPGSCLYCQRTEKSIANLPANLAGAVFASSCTAQEKLFEVYFRRSGLDFVEILDVPKVLNKHAVQRYAGQLKLLAKALEEKTGSKIKTEELIKAIKLNNAFREKLKKQNTYRIQILKDDALDLNNLKEKTNSIRTLPAETLQEQKVPNLLFIGTRVREDVIQAVSRQAGGNARIFLTDDGLYYNSIKVDESYPDPWQALAEGYLTLPYWRRGISFLPDIDKLKRLILDEELDGLVTLHYPFCSKLGYDISWLFKHQEQFPIPFLQLQLESVDEIPAAAINRLTAFIEMLQERNK